MSFIIDPYRYAAAFTGVPGALVYYTSAVGGTNYLFTSEAYDTHSFHSNSVNTDALSVQGYTLVRALGQEQGTGSSTPGPKIQKNGIDFLGGALAVTQDDLIGVRTGPIAVTGGDYLNLVKGSLGTPDTAGGIWFAIETLDSSTKYALVSSTSNQALSAGVSAAIAFDSEVTDTDGFHDNVTNNSRLTVPSGVTRVKLVANLRSTANVSAAYVVVIRKNGANAAGCPAFGSTTTGQVNLSTALLEVTPGDYFEVIANSASAQTVATGNHTWFSIYEMPDYARALVKKVATQSVTTGSGHSIVFGAGSTVYDTANAHDEVTNNTRLTVPVGFTKAKVSFSLVTASATGTPSVFVIKNGSHPVPGLPGMNCNLTGAEYMCGEGAWMDVIAGDYFELRMFTGANQTLPIDDRTWFAIELQ